MRAPGERPCGWGGAGGEPQAGALSVLQVTPNSSRWDRRAEPNPTRRPQAHLALPGPHGHAHATLTTGRPLLTAPQTRTRLTAQGPRSRKRPSRSRALSRCTWLSSTCRERQGSWRHLQGHAGRGRSLGSALVLHRGPRGAAVPAAPEAQRPGDTALPPGHSQGHTHRYTHRPQPQLTPRVTPTDTPIGHSHRSIHR